MKGITTIFGISLLLFAAMAIVNAAPSGDASLGALTITNATVVASATQTFNVFEHTTQPNHVIYLYVYEETRTVKHKTVTTTIVSQFVYKGYTDGAGNALFVLNGSTSKMIAAMHAFLPATPYGPSPTAYVANMLFK